MVLHQSDYFSQLNIFYSFIINAQQISYLFSYLQFVDLVILIPGRHSKKQQLEIACGIEASGHEFLWVSPKNMYVDVEEWLPHDFEERIKENNKGMVVRALLHQQLMLKHMVIGSALITTSFDYSIQMAEAGGSSQTETTTKPQLIYRCKKCRRIVASEENIVSHERGKGESSFKWKKRSSESWEMEKQSVDCTSVFVEPMKWMQAVQEGHVEEKLLCMGCNARLGYFNWAGMQCSCGAWVNPAFQLHKSKLDECNM
ncbi:putative inactive dual specificity protein phosphatase-like [Glycine soja]|nr:putative inactive dual specificity protein phosphatase-like [Glycine soja]